MKIGLDHIRLKWKMLILYFSCVFIPILFTNVMFYNMTIENVKNNQVEVIARAVEQIKYDFKHEIEAAIAISTIFYFDYNLNEILEGSYEDAGEYVTAYDSYYRRLISSYTPVYSSVQNIKIYVDNPTILHAGGVGDLSDEVRESDWYHQLMNSNSSSPIIVRTHKEDDYERDVNPKKDMFSIIRNMNYFKINNKWEKVLKIELRTSVIDRIFHNLNVQGDLYLLNERNEVEYTTDPTILWSSDVISYESLNHEDSIYEYISPGEFSDYFPGWRLVAAIPSDIIFSKVSESKYFIFILAVINIVVPTIIIVWMTRSLNVRIGRLLTHMKRVKNQKFDLIRGEIARDEIGQLTGEFNRMTLQIKRLINDVYVADIMKKNLALQSRDAQLKALQSQINPHFLFNALEAIRMRSLIKKEDETAKIIHNMAKIFRNSLAWKKDIVTIEEELEFIHCFLEIQQYRFGDKHKYEVNVDEEAYKYTIPKMTFLPFVENASIHGIERLKADGFISIDIFREQHHLVFRLEDNGVGMSEEQVKRLYRYLENDEDMGDRVGIQNVIYRLKLYYVDQFQFNIQSEKGLGTKIEIKIPIQV